MGPIAATARACCTVGIDMRSGSALLLGVLIIVSRPTPAAAQEAPTPSLSEQGVPAPGGTAPVALPETEVERPLSRSAPADPASRRAAPTRTGSRRQTSKTCRPA